MNSKRFDVIVTGSGLGGLQAAANAAAQSTKLRVALLTTASENAYGGCSFKTHGNQRRHEPWGYSRTARAGHSRGWWLDQRSSLGPYPGTEYSRRDSSDGGARSALG